MVGNRRHIPEPMEQQWVTMSAQRYCPCHPLKSPYSQSCPLSFASHRFCCPKTFISRSPSSTYSSRCCKRTPFFWLELQHELREARDVRPLILIGPCTDVDIHVNR
ncbi:hypothetical protein M405DRAFT_413925 [Rhizopogon salebrosus TDB-379]|nr:hypothetical protein M405DRAFT_413925 [Rhizopogon salebrosus TDB-379]